MTASAHVYAIGVQCALGQNYSTVIGAYSDNENNFIKSSRGPIGVDGRPIVLSAAFPFDKMRNFELRLQRLFAGAAADLMAQRQGWTTMPLKLVVAPWFKGHVLESRLCTWITETYPTLFEAVETVPDGETLGLLELVHGLQEIGDGKRTSCAVGALDSYMDAELLDLLSLENRVLSDFAPHGLIPSEACVLMILGQNAAIQDIRPIGSIRSAFMGFEREVVSRPDGVIGRGLAKPLRQAFEKFVPHRFLADLNGERWRSEDLGFALSGARIPDALLGDFETPLSQTGDCGAANGLLLAALALASIRRSRQPDEVADITQPCLAIVSTAHRAGPRCVVAMELHGKDA